METLTGKSTIFFDAGGVLFDTEISRDERIRRVLRARGYTDLQIENGISKGEEFASKFLKTGKWLSSWKDEESYWNAYYDKVVRGVTNDSIYSLKKQLLHQTHYAINCKLFDEVREVLEQLHGTYRLGVISNAFPSMDWIFDWLNIRKYFESITISAFVGISKPSYGIYEHALRSLNVTSEECIFIDDKEVNIKAANDIGFKGIHLDRNLNDLRILVANMYDDNYVDQQCV